MPFDRIGHDQITLPETTSAHDDIRMRCSLRHAWVWRLVNTMMAAATTVPLQVWKLGVRRYSGASS